MNEQKKGIFTSEFWGMLLSIVGMLVNVLVGKLSPELFATISAVLVGIYTIARTVVKLTPSTKDDEFLKKLKDEILSKFGVKDEEK